MSQTSTSQPPQIKSRIGAILRATSGNFLEQFDFFLFGFYAPYIAKAFFPSENETAALLNTFGVFWLGALMRPVGAIVLGAYIDRIGRRLGLIVTLAIMAAGTVVITICPTYATIGVAAPVIVLIGRLLQGFSAGVELGGVSVYLSEIATPGNKGFYTSFQSASQQVAIFVAATIGFGLNEMVPAATVAAWGWRIPFLIGCLIIPFIFVLRRTLEETPAFLAMKKHPTTSEVFASAAANWKIIVLGMMLAAMTTVTFYFVTVYTPTFGKTVLKLSTSDSLLVTLMVAVTNFIWNPVGGAVSDRLGRKPVLLTIAGLSFVTAYPALLWLTAAPTFGKMLAVGMMFSLYFGVYSGTMLGALVEVVPAHVRTTCFSLAFALAAALFGTFTPFAATKLIDMTGDKASPGFWLMCAAASGIVAAIVIYHNTQRAVISLSAQLMLLLGSFVIVGALGWWYVFYSKVVQQALQAGQQPSIQAAIPCLYANGDVCGFIKSLSQIGGVIPYEPFTLWFGVAILFVGILVAIFTRSLEVSRST